MSNNNIVFVLGAGFSVPAELPLQNNLLEMLFGNSNNNYNDIFSFVPNSTPETLNFLDSHIQIGLFLLSLCHNNRFELFNNEYKRCKLNKALSNFAKFYSDDIFSRQTLKRDFYQLREEIKKELNKKIFLKLKNINIEDIFTSIDKSIVKEEYFNGYSPDKLMLIKNSLLRLFIYFFSEKLRANQSNILDYVEFVKYLKKLRRKRTNISIITTNWDTLLEKKFHKYNIDYNLALNEKYYYSNKIHKKNNKSIKLIKVHGSINWFRCMKCNTINIKTIDKKYVFEEERCFCCDNTSKEDILFEPEIITPSMIKLFDRQIYRNLWQSAAFELGKADEINFIGYSYPVADYEFRNLLQKNINNTTKINVVLHKQDKPTKNNDNYNKFLPEQRFKTSFQFNEIKFHYNGFGKYFHKLNNNQVAKV